MAVSVYITLWVTWRCG